MSCLCHMGVSVTVSFQVVVMDFSKTFDVWHEFLYKSTEIRMSHTSDKVCLSRQLSSNSLDGVTVYCNRWWFEGIFSKPSKPLSQKATYRETYLKKTPQHFNKCNDFSQNTTQGNISQKHICCFGALLHLLSRRFLSSFRDFSHIRCRSLSD